MRLSKPKEISVSKQFPRMCPKRIKIPKTKTSRAKTLTVLQGVSSAQKVERPDVVTSGAVDGAERTSKSYYELSVSEHCAEKLRSSGEAEVNELVDLGGQSVAEIIG